MVAPKSDSGHGTFDGTEKAVCTAEQCWGIGVDGDRKGWGAKACLHDLGLVRRVYLGQALMQPLQSIPCPIPGEA